jgi:hypothetical protein
MAMTTTERTSWILTVPYHASADQELGRDATATLFDLEVFAAERNFGRGPVDIRYVAENLSDIDVESITFKDSAAGYPEDSTPSWSAVDDEQHDPAYPLVAGGRITGYIRTNADAKYLQVLGHQEADASDRAVIRLTLEVISGGHPIA